MVRGHSPRATHRGEQSLCETGSTVRAEGQRDYDEWDLERLPESAIPRTNWQRKADRKTFELALPTWGDVKSTERYRLVSRTMLAPHMYRTVHISLLAPKASTMSGCYTGWYESDRLTVAFCGLASSLLCDFGIRASGVKNLHTSAISRLPAPDDDHPLIDPLVHRTLRLNCLTKEFAKLWSLLVDNEWDDDNFTQVHWATRSISCPPPVWDMSVPVRTELDRVATSHGNRRSRRIDSGRRKRWARGCLQFAVWSSSQLRTPNGFRRQWS